MREKKVLTLIVILILVFLFNITAYATGEGKAIKEIKFLTKKSLYENALVRANFYLNSHPESLRVRKLKIDLLIKLARFDEALKNYEIFIMYSKAKKENIEILSDILVNYLHYLKGVSLTPEQKKRLFSILCEIKDKETIKTLKEIYYLPPSREDKIWAASLLSQLGKKGYISYLRKTLKLQALSFNEKLYIITALASRNSTLFIKDLHFLLKNEKNPEVIAYIYWALTKLGESHRKELRHMLNRVDNHTKSIILFLLGELKDDEFKLDGIINDKEVLISLYWAEYRKGERSALYKLRKELSSPSKDVTLSSIFYIGLIGDKRSIPILRNKITNTDDMDIKLMSIISIIRIIRSDRISADIKIKIGFSITL